MSISIGKGRLKLTTNLTPVKIGRPGAITGANSSLFLDFLSGSLDASIDFTRTSAATYVDATGKIVSTPASRNLLTYTQEFDNAAWSKSNATVTANSATAPDGTLTADTLVPNNGASDGQTTQVVASVSVSTAYAYSFYVKSAGLNSARFRLTARTAGNVFVSDLQVDADLSSGTVGAVTSGTFTGTSASITSVGGGWYRVSLIGTTPATTAILWASVRYPPAGNGTSGLYLWGAQLEAASAASTYTRNVGGLYPPRFDYDPVTLAPRGLLIEEQRTNLLLRSEQFDNAAWTKSRATVTANATTSPDGTADADKLIEDTANGTHRVYQQATKAASSLTRTFSVFLKAAERTFAQVRMSDNIEAVTVLTNVDLTAGTTTAPTIPGGSSISAASARIVPAGSGWYRVSITATLDATITNPGAFVFVCESLGGSTYTGNGTSGIFVWGAQWEDGAFSTSYIPTVASQVTRTADLAAVTGANFSRWYNQSEGTFVAEFDCSGSSSVLSADDTTNNNFIRVGRINTTGRLRVFNGGVDQADVLPANAPGWSGVVKIAAAYKANDFAASASGGTASADTSGTIPTVTQFRLGTAGSGDPINGHIRRIRYYPTRLSNAQLQALTA